MNRRLTTRGKERRAQLMTEAARRFAENGYHPTSVADVVDAVGVGKGVFYWYFSSKEELFVEILRDAQFSLRRRQQALIGAEPDPVMRLELGMLASMEWFSENRHIFNLFQFAATEEAFEPTLREGQEVGFADAMRHVKEGMAEGRLRVDDPFLVTSAIVGVTNELARKFIFDRNDPPADVAGAASAFLMYGLLRTPPAPTTTTSRPSGIDDPDQRKVVAASAITSTAVGSVAPSTGA